MLRGRPRGHDNTFGYRPGALPGARRRPDPDLPDLAEADAWAHVQIAGGLPASAAAYRTLLERQPERTLSRLVCPRLLTARTSYRACVVPAFEAGRQGLGAELDGVPAATPAWDHQASDPVDLPVYLAGPSPRRRMPDSRPWSAGSCPVRGPAARRRPARSRPEPPGFGLPDAPGSTTPIGVRSRCREAPSPWPDSARRSRRSSTAWTRSARRSTVAGWRPSTGCAGGASCRAAAPDSGRPRVQTVRAEQEQLMAAAWDQLGEVLRANQLLRQAQLALQVGTRVRPAFRRPVRLRGAPARGTGPGPDQHHGRDAYGRGSLEQSCLPAIACHAGFRRLIRPRGRLARRAARPLDGRPLDVTAVLQELLTGDLTAPPTVPAGAAVVGTDERDAILDALRGQPASARWRAGSSRSAPGRPGRRVSCRPRTWPTGCSTGCGRSTRCHRGRGPRSGCHRASVRWPARWSRSGGAADRHPDVPVPGGARPGLAAAGSAARAAEHRLRARTDNSFVEAFLVGLNHEMGRELLWRGYPTDQRGPSRPGSGTWFSRTTDRTAAQGSLDRPLAAELGLGVHRPPSTPGWAWCCCSAVT